MDEPVKPDAVEADGAEEAEDEPAAVTHPTKLIRIASMTRAMLEEARQAPLDENGRKRMAMVHARSIEELREILSPELQEEFSEVMVPLSEEGATEAELRVAQAQLIGWLEGVFHGIQASIWSQQMTAQSQLAEMQKRALDAPRRPDRDDSSGLYL
jgi:hypothetical protein